MADTAPTGLTLTADQTRRLGLVLGSSIAAAEEAGMDALAAEAQALTTELYPDGWTAPVAGP